MKTRTVATAMPMREYHALKRIARAQGTTLAGLVRGLLVAFLRTVAEPKQEQDREASHEHGT